jgi:two-component system, NtrC family, sensor kinase
VNPASDDPVNAELAALSRTRPASVRRVRQSMLVAEDSKIIRAKLTMILGTLDGVDLRVAGDGLEALALAREHRPDLVLTDNEMPGMTGIQLLRVLRNTWSPLELPILMLTANSATETKVQAFRYGANDYVTKPVEAAELCARVRGQLDLKLAIQENLQARVQLLEARKYQAVGRLAAGVAHELNNPAQYTSSNLSYLAKSFAAARPVLQSTLEWAKAHQQDPFAVQLRRQAQQLGLEEMLQEVPLAVEEAVDGIRRMAHIIREMKEFAGDPHAELVELDLAEALRNVVEVSRSSFSASLDVELKLGAGVPRVRCAAHPIKQAFLNMMTNAAEAVQTLGRRGKLVISTAAVRDGVELRFCDDGPGIQPELQPQIFEPFFTTKPLGQGMGQGLFVAYAIVVEQNGGRLHCESQPGAGATFVVWLPT